MTKYIPERGDIIWVDLDPVKGHEQGGRRPAFVASSRSYNGKSGLMLICPVTSQIKNYPFEVTFVSRQVKGTILVDQIRSIDWGNRNIDLAGRVTSGIIEAVRGRLIRLIEK